MQNLNASTVTRQSTKSKTSTIYPAPQGNVNEINPIELRQKGLA